MDKNSYITGTWLGIVRQGAVVVVEADTDPAIVNHLWECLGDQPTINGVLHEVTEQFGTGLAELPNFAILLRGERLHAILRGDIDLVAHTENGAELVSGRDVATWSERSLPLPGSLELVCAETAAGEPAQASVHDGRLVLPVGEAVVRMKSLRLGVPSDASAAHRFFAKTPAEALQHFEADTAVEGMGSGEGTAADGETDSDIHAALAGNAADGTHPADGTGPDGGIGAADGLAPEDGFAFDTDFAMAAQAADAEWNAQLAPVTGASVENDPGLTIRPDGADEFGQYHHDAADEDHAADAASGAGHGAGGDEAGFDGGAGSDVAGGPDTGNSGEPAPADPADTGSEAAAVDAAGGNQGSARNPEPDSDDDGFTTNYDFLFGATVAQSVDNAAVRLGEDGAPLPEPAGPVVPPLPMQPPAVGGSVQDAGLGPERQPASGSASDVVPGADPAAGPSAEVGSGSGAGSGSAAEPDVAGSGAMLIDSVPWAKPVQQFPVTQAPAAQAAQAVAGAPAVQPDTDEKPYDPDHDGRTVLRGQFPAAPAGGSNSGMGHDDGAKSAPGTAPGQQVLASRPPTGPMVLARVCPNGHANPPSLPVCGRCNATELSEPREVGRPRLGRMYISTGEVIDLDHSLIIGRQPSVSRVMGEAMPRLVQVKSANGDISRSHVEVRPDGWEVLLVDLKATNGTVLVREGQAPRRLGQGEEAILINGDIAELGDGVSLLFDGLL